MKKYILKINIFILSFMFAMPQILVYADSDEELVIRNISNAILSIVLWFAYAIALGSLIFFGIKYMLSGANERANLKGMLPRFIIGVALIVMCFGLASSIAKIAGNDTAEEIIKVGKEAGDHFTGVSNNSSITGVFEGSYSAGGTPDNPYMEVEKVNNSDGTYTKTYSGANRNEGDVVAKFANDGRLLEEEKYDENGNIVSKTTYDENGVYAKDLYSIERITVDEFIKGEVTDALRTQDNGNRLIATYTDTDEDSIDDKIYYKDTDGTVVGDGYVLYDEQGRIWRIFRTEYENGVDGKKKEEFYTEITYNDNGNITIENIDALAIANNQQYKYDVITRNDGTVSSVTYSEYVTDLWEIDHYEEIGTTNYNVPKGP